MSRRDRFLEDVVVGTDFSVQAEVALSWAALVARSHGAVLHLVHAISRTLPFVERLAAFSALARVGGEAEEERVHERPSVAVLQTAARYQAGLIVLGTRGEGGFRQLHLGSTAERVVQRATCPVLTVSPDCRLASRWPSRVLVATDFSGEGDAAVKAVEKLLCHGDRPVEILVLTVLHIPGGLEANAEINSLWRDYVAECRKLLAERMETVKASIESKGLSIQVLLREGIPAEQISRVAEEEEVDVVALGSRGAFAAGRAFLGSVSKRVMQTAHCPTLVVPSSVSREGASAAST